jgi:hypothetical protein
MQTNIHTSCVWHNTKSNKIRTDVCGTVFSHSLWHRVLTVHKQGNVFVASSYVCLKPCVRPIAHIRVYCPVECNLLGCSPACLFHVSSTEQTPCSETSAIKHHTPGNNPEDYTQNLEHGESLKSRIYCPLRLWPRHCDSRGSVPGWDGHSRVSHCFHSSLEATLDLSKLPGAPSIGKAFGQCNQSLTCS